MSLDVMLSEWRKLRVGWWWLFVMVLGLLVSLLGVVGLAIDNRARLESGATTAELATSEVARYWFAMHLFTSILAGLYVTREFSTGAIGRTVLLSRLRSHVIYGKLVSVVIFSAIVAALVAALAYATPLLAIDKPFQPAWTGDATLSVIGVCFALIAGAVWGLMLGFIIRSSAGVIGAILITTLVIDETVFTFFPNVGKFSFTIALGAAFRDARPDLLSPLMGYIVAGIWLAAATAIAHWSFNNRDVL